MSNIFFDLSYLPFLSSRVWLKHATSLTGGLPCSSFSFFAFNIRFNWSSMLGTNTFLIVWFLPYNIFFLLLRVFCLFWMSMLSIVTVLSAMRVCCTVVRLCMFSIFNFLTSTSIFGSSKSNEYPISCEFESETRCYTSCRFFKMFSFLAFWAFLLSFPVNSMLLLNFWIKSMTTWSSYFLSI